MKEIIKIIILSLLLVTITACGRPSEDKISSQMKKYLYEKYGEEFEVDMIGVRSGNGKKFYEARIYPKSIIGTPKENDEYYYGSASIRVNPIGSLAKETGDDYSFIKRDDDVENYFLPKAKELFGEKIRLKVEARHEKTGDGSWWAGYKSDSLKEMREAVKENPAKNRIVLELKIFIFDKIDNKKEEEERKKQLFEFLQYLRKEKLDNYLKIDCNFMDDIVLAPTFEENREILKHAEYISEKVEIEKKLREEVAKLSEKEILDNMNGIVKSELEYKGLFKDVITDGYNISSLFISSIEYLKQIQPYSYEHSSKQELEQYKYNNYSDIDGYENEKYLFRKGIE